VACEQSPGVRAIPPVIRPQDLEKLVFFCGGLAKGVLDIVLQAVPIDRMPVTRSRIVDDRAFYLLEWCL
jgi:hypothetical protein